MDLGLFDDFAFPVLSDGPFKIRVISDEAILQAKLFQSFFVRGVQSA